VQIPHWEVCVVAEPCTAYPHYGIAAAPVSVGRGLANGGGSILSGAQTQSGAATESEPLSLCSITHEFLAYMWACATRALLEPPVLCAKRKLIRYSRGGLINLDGRGLEAPACSCYAAVKETYTRVLS
jgi:hypothetical protein